MAVTNTYTNNGGQQQLVSVFTGGSTGATAAFPIRTEKPLNIEATGDATGFSFRFERKLPGAAASSPLTAQGSPLCVWTANCSEKWVETEEGTLGYLVVTVLGAGTLTLRMSQ